MRFFFLLTHNTLFQSCIYFNVCSEPCSSLFSVVCCALLRWGVWTACSRTCGVLFQWCLGTESPVKWTCWRLRPSTSGSCRPCSNTPLPPWVSQSCSTSLPAVLEDLTGVCVFVRVMGMQVCCWRLESTARAWRPTALISGAWRMWVLYS